MENESRKLGQDALEDVTGGADTSEKVASLGHPIHRTGTVRVMNRDGGQPTVMAYCPTCGRITEFTVFSGARAKCNECGQMKSER